MMDLHVWSCFREDLVVFMGGQIFESSSENMKYDVNGWTSFLRKNSIELGNGNSSLYRILKNTKGSGGVLHWVRKRNLPVKTQERVKVSNGRLQFCTLSSHGASQRLLGDSVWDSSVCLRIDMFYDFELNSIVECLTDINSRYTRNGVSLSENCLMERLQVAITCERIWSGWNNGKNCDAKMLRRPTELGDTNLWHLLPW